MVLKVVELPHADKSPKWQRKQESDHRFEVFNEEKVGGAEKKGKKAKGKKERSEEAKAGEEKPEGKAKEQENMKIPKAENAKTPKAKAAKSEQQEKSSQKVKTSAATPAGLSMWDTLGASSHASSHGSPKGPDGWNQVRNYNIL